MLIGYKKSLNLLVTMKVLDFKMHCLKCIFSLALLLAIGFSIVEGLSTCPTDAFIKEREEAVEAVEVSVRSVFSKVLNDSTISNASLSSEEVYEHIATSVGVSVTPSGFVRFQEAVSEVTVAKLDACATIDASKLNATYISELTKRFITLTDARNISLAREVYGRLLCIQDLLSPSDESRRKRQGDPAAELAAFFDSLDGERLATIFVYVTFDDQEPVPTLAFVVDDTGSMGAEISAVQRLIRSFIKTERSEPFAYILTTFNDPDVGVPRKYSANSRSELAELERAVNALRAHGGGDCPELGMTGILNALNLSNPLSNVIVLTDASPKDGDRKDEVLRAAYEKETSIHFFLSRTGCGNFTPYLDVARETFGVVVNQIDEFEAFSEFASRVRGRFTRSLLDDGNDKQKRGLEVPKTCVDFSVSVFTRSVDILFSSVSNGTVITITAPIETEYYTIEARGTIATYTLTDPLPLTYTICSDSAFEHSISTTSDLDFFVEYDVNTSRTLLPTPGTPVKVIISSSKIDEISTEGVFLDLVMRDGVVSCNAMSHCGSLLSGVIIVPSEPFRYQLRGFDSKGNSFTETEEVRLEPEVETCDEPTPTSTSPTASPTPGFVDCPCLNGGRCVTFEQFGRTRIVCRCQEGYSGSQCQDRLP